MNDPPLLTPYWSSAFAKQMKPPTLAPYMVALLCMGPCHGQAHTRDPTIGFSPPALLYLLLVIFSAWCKQCLTFPPFFFFFFFLCRVEHFAVSKLQTLILFLCSRKNESQHLLWLPGRRCRTQEVFHSRRLLRVYCSGMTWCNPRGKSWHFLNASAAFLPCVDFTKDRQRGEGAGEVKTCLVFICNLKIL